jgi:hypothetical protein
MKEACEFQIGENSFLLLFKGVNRVMPLFIYMQMTEAPSS